MTMTQPKRYRRRIDEFAKAEDGGPPQTPFRITICDSRIVFDPTKSARFRAYLFGAEAHDGQQRASGEPTSFTSKLRKSSRHAP